MGHLLFFVLHLIAILFTGMILLFITIPLHLIYASSRRTRQITEQALQPEVYQAKQKRKRTVLMTLAVVFVGLYLIGKYTTHLIVNETESVSLTDGATSALVGSESDSSSQDEVIAEIKGREEPETPSIPLTGKWRVSEAVNPVDDTPTVHLQLIATTGESRWGDEVSLFIVCRSDTTNLYINWGDYLGSETKVLTRVGKEPASTKLWALSTDKKASFYPSKKITFIKSLFAVDSLVAQTTPFNESPITAEFDVSGLQEAIKPLRTACHW